jgi:hypothetical protein
MRSKNNLVRGILISCALFSSCNKETKVNQVHREPTELISNLVNHLRNSDSVSVFVKLLKNVSLTVEETKDGITLLIPLNGNSGQPGKLGFTADSLVNITDAMVKDHIIPGRFDYAQLAVRKSFTTLSGKAITIIRSADTIWVNGIQIGGKQTIVNNNYIVHTLKTTLSLSHHADTLTTTSLDVEVWDVTRWSANRPKGELAPHALVKAYASIDDYNQGIVAAQNYSNYRGRALLKNLGTGRYFLEANLNGKSNVFVSTIIPALDHQAGYAISGIFQNQQEINSAPVQSNATPGNFRWVDSNSDGKINSIDYRALPHESTETIDGVKLRKELLIGFPRNR